MEGRIQSIELSYLVHATEDPEKIRRAASDLLSGSFEPETEPLQGHYGNEIVRVRLHLTGKEAEKAFEAMVSRMPRATRAEVASNIGDYVDEHSALFVRFDKQGLVSGRVALGTGDSVRVKVKPRAFMIKGGAAGFYQGLLS